jgi:hypothetical protein
VRIDPRCEFSVRVHTSAFYASAALFHFPSDVTMFRWTAGQSECSGEVIQRNVSATTPQFSATTGDERSVSS